MFADSDSAHAISLVVVSRMSAFPSRRPTPFRRVALHDPAMSNTRSLPPFFYTHCHAWTFCDSTGLGLTTGL
jgi:hypothetical protein